MAVPLLRLDDVMAELGIGRTKVHALVWSGELPIVRIGRAIRVRRADLDAFVEAHLTGRGRRKSRTITAVAGLDDGPHVRSKCNNEIPSRK
jgi:excisionase family DNA binding protein